MAKVYTKGQVTIPKAVREAAGIEIGDSVVVESRDGEIVIRKPKGVLEFVPPRPILGLDDWNTTRRLAREEYVRRKYGTSDRAV